MSKRDPLPPSATAGPHNDQRVWLRWSGQVSGERPLQRTQTEPVAISTGKDERIKGDMEAF